MVSYRSYSYFSILLVGLTPLYRLWNGPMGDHLYTTSVEEQQDKSKHGYVIEGWFIYTFIDAFFFQVMKDVLEVSQILNALDLFLFIESGLVHIVSFLLINNNK
jgi:hypothetical protein